MKIIFFSDIHGNHYAAHRFFEDIQGISYDKLIFGGDVLGYYYEPDDIISLLRQKRAYCLLGNHDQMFLDVLEGAGDESELIKQYGSSYQNAASRVSKENVDFLYCLKSRLDMETDGLRLVFVHGSVPEPLNGRVYPDTEIDNDRDYDGIDFVFAGHTHHKMVKSLKNGCTIINPGSAGQQRDGKGCSYVIFDTVLRSFSFCPIPFEPEPLIRDIYRSEHDRKMREKLIEVLLRKVSAPP